LDWRRAVKGFRISVTIYDHDTEEIGTSFDFTRLCVRHADIGICIDCFTAKPTEAENGYSPISGRTEAEPNVRLNPIVQYACGIHCLPKLKITRKITARLAMDQDY
jgi:hypothetical protein